jgi:hypothetical protein
MITSLNNTTLTSQNLLVFNRYVRPVAAMAFTAILLVNNLNEQTF